MIRLVNPAGLPEPRGFSHAVESEGSRTLWMAGQTGHDADGSISEHLVDQFSTALAALAACMAEAGFPPESLVRMEIYTTDVAEYRASLGPLGVAYRAIFGRHYPAMALFGVAALFDPAARVEVVGTAVL